MWNRNKIDPYDTINLCNQFLIVHLIKKIKISQARGNNSSQYTNVYRNAINSIKKYPLPIICKAQLQSIQGIGDSLSQDLEKHIKKHYSVFINPDLTDKLQKIEQNKKFCILKQKTVQNEQQVDQKSNYSINDDSKSIKSGIQYKPRINTANAYCLQIIKKFSQKHSNQLVQKQLILQQVRAKFSISKNKGWNNLQSLLQTNGYIMLEKKNDQKGKQLFYYKLTFKGLDYLKILEEKQKTNFSKNKLLSEVKIFKNIIDQKVKNYTLQNLTNDQQDSTKLKYERKTIKLQQNQKQVCFNNLQLVIDNRQRKQKNQSNFFLDKISKKFNLKCKNANLSLGDFIWVYKNKVLDFIVQRKKADDLASSIIDGRYKDQKYRLKNSGLSNIFYIYEGYPSDNCPSSQRQLMNALLKTQIKQKFKVYKTKDVSQTLRLLNDMHQIIYQKLLKGQIEYLCSLQEFIEQNSVHKNLTIGKIFGLGLLSIPGIGKKATKTLLLYFKSYRSMYNYLNQKFNNNQERIIFLKQLFKGSGIMTNISKIFVGLLFQNNYQNQDKQNMIYSNSFSSQNITQEKQNPFYFQKKKRFSIIKEQNQSHQNQLQLQF